jgi:hypothetical protein
MPAKQRETPMRRSGAAGYAALLLTLLVAVPALPQTATRIGQIKTVTGDATIARNGVRLPAKPGDPMYQGDIVETGADGAIGITLADNSLLSNGPDSKLEMQVFRFDVSTLQGAMLASLRKGTLTVVSGDIAHKSAGAMQIRTPTATLAVRGTTFAIDVR